VYSVGCVSGFGNAIRLNVDKASRDFKSPPPERNGTSDYLIPTRGRHSILKPGHNLPS
jgi:hypothetical protein